MLLYLKAEHPCLTVAQTAISNFGVIAFLNLCLQSVDPECGKLFLVDPGRQG